MNATITPPETLPALLNETAVATQLGISLRHLRTLRSRRLIPYLKLGKAVRFDPAAVSAAISRLTVTTPARES